MSVEFHVVGIMDSWKKGDLPGNQMVNIVLKPYLTLNDGLVVLTAQLASDQEVDYAVDQLIKDLEVARKKAKEKIKKTNERILSTLREK